MGRDPPVEKHCSIGSLSGQHESDNNSRMKTGFVYCLGTMGPERSDYNGLGG